MSLNFCDLLVLGSDLSGIMTATLLAKRGMNVLILDDDEEEDPSPNLVIGLGSRGFKSLLGKLMIPDAKLQILHENRIGCQVVFPKHRFDLYTSRPLFFKEVEREFPNEKQLLEELLGEIDRLRENYLEEILSFLPIVGPREKKRFIKWFQNFPDEKTLSLWNRLSPILQCLIRVQLRFLSRSALLEPLILPLLFFLPPEEGVTFSIRGGVRELKKLFFNKLDYFGGMVHPLGPESFQILTKGREIRAIQMSRYNFPTRCRFILGNSNIQSLYQELPSPFFPFLFNRTRKKVLSLEPREERQFVQYQTSREILPTPMKENVVFVTDPSAPLEGTNYLEINLSPIPKVAPKGNDDELDTLLSVSYMTKPAARSAELEVYKEIDLKLRHLVPFANSHLTRIFPPSDPSSNGPTKEPELFPEERPRVLFSRNHQKKWTAYSPSLFFPSMASPFKNLFVLGPNILSGLGMEGKMLTALKAVDLIWSKELKVRNA